MINDRALFHEDTALFLERAIKDFISTSPTNRLPSFDNAPIFDEPLVGFADGDDPLFQQYKKIIGEFHLTPREIMEISIKENHGKVVKTPARVSVISFVVPINEATRLSQWSETHLASLRWNHTRWQGQDCMVALAKYLVSLIDGSGYHAVAPEIESFFKVSTFSTGLASNWSQRHVAYVAGLGTFSLSDSFITPKGAAMRCGSVVCDMAISPTRRIFKNHLANCLFYRGATCTRCIERCPAGAISKRGHDKNACRNFLDVEQKRLLKELGREEGYIGRYVGCGLCQTNVPCEAQIPSQGTDRHHYAD